MQFTDTAIRLSGVTALVLGWVPDVFWRATPDELAAILDVANSGTVPFGGGGGGGAPPDAATIARLMEMYPDG